MSAAPVLNFPTLVLNRNWTPLQTTTCKEAIALVAKGSAHVVDPVTYEVHDLDSWHAASRATERFGNERIRSTFLSLAPPEVIVLSIYEGIGNRTVVFSRRNLFKRDQYSCQYCGKHPGLKNLTIDHVNPRSKGGKSTWENCVLACVKCNTRKGGRTPSEARMRILKKPRQPTWESVSDVLTTARRESWKKFISRAYWEVELEP